MKSRMSVLFLSVVIFSGVASCFEGSNVAEATERLSVLEGLGQTIVVNLTDNCTQSSCNFCYANQRSNCTSCTSGYYLSGGWCYTCGSNCNSCSSYSYCYSCNTGYQMSSSGECFKQTH